MLAQPPLELLLEGGGVHGDRGRGGHRVEERDPFLVDVEDGAVEDLEHADRLAVGEERQGAIGLEPFTCEKRAAAKLPGPLGVGADVVAAVEPAAEQRCLGEVGRDRQPGVRRQHRTEADRRAEVQLDAGVVDQEHVGRVDMKPRADLLQDQLQSEPEVLARRDRHGDVADRDEPLEAHGGRTMALRVFDERAEPVRHHLDPGDVAAVQRSLGVPVGV